MTNLNFFYLDRYSSRNLSAPIKANLHFSLSRSGIISLDRGDAVVEITEWVEVPKTNVTVDNNTTTTTGNASEESSQEKKEDLQADDGNSTASDATTEEPAVVETERKLKKRTFRVALKVCVVAYCFQIFA